MLLGAGMRKVPSLFVLVVACRCESGPGSCQEAVTSAEVVYLIFTGRDLRALQHGYVKPDFCGSRGSGPSRHPWGLFDSGVLWNLQAIWRF